MAGRISAAILGSLVFSMSLMIALSLYLPVPPGDRLLYAGMAQPLIWVAGLAYGFLSASALRAWLVLISLSVLLGASSAAKWMI